MNFYFSHKKNKKIKNNCTKLTIKINITIKKSIIFVLIMMLKNLFNLKNNLLRYAKQ